MEEVQGLNFILRNPASFSEGAEGVSCTQETIPPDTGGARAGYLEPKEKN